MKECRRVLSIFIKKNKVEPKDEHQNNPVDRGTIIPVNPGRMRSDVKGQPEKPGFTLPA
jgi:hypothetical protein